VQVEFDPEVISLREILEIFFATHDPTTLDQQGADTGTQYRSVILYDSDEQRAVAEEVIAELEAEGLFDDPIVTEVVPLETFYPAEDYHQEYYSRNPAQGYCRVVIDPKMAKFRAKFAGRLRENG
jgi:peptide-methionine (S)-S-oxide reductase